MEESFVGVQSTVDFERIQQDRLHDFFEFGGGQRDWHNTVLMTIFVKKIFEYRTVLTMLLFCHTLSLALLSVAVGKEDREREHVRRSSSCGTGKKAKSVCIVQRGIHGFHKYQY